MLDSITQFAQPFLTGDPLLRELTLGVHILAGLIALLAGIGAILTPKGGTRHNKIGRLYVVSMGVVVVTAVPLSLWIESWFLLAIAVFSGYLVFAGYRIILRRRARLSRLTASDYLLHGTMLGAGGLMIGGGTWQIGTGTVGLAPVLLVFGAIGSGLAVTEIRTVRSQGENSTPWFQRHITYMGGAYIATVTATITVNLTMLPTLSRWLGPTIVGVPLILYAIRTYEPVFGHAAG